MMALLLLHYAITYRVLPHKCIRNIAFEAILKNKRMNTRLVDSLVHIIESLNPEERILLQERLSGNPIQVTIGICGGQPRIRNTRIPVWSLVSFRQLGADDEELLRNYPTLTREDLKTAWAYYEQHREECDQVLAGFERDDDG